MLAFRDFDKRHGRKHGADFTPLIDVVFNLLLFYLLTSSVMVSSFTVTLPAAHGEAESPAGHTLSLTREGGLYWDGRSVSQPELKRILEAALDKRLSLEADAAAPFGGVTELLDAARAAGFMEISFNVLEKSP